LDWKAVCRRLEIEPRSISPALTKDLAGLGFGPGFKIIGLPGGASNRGYLRVKFNAGARPPSLVVMVLREPDFKQGVEEVLEDGFEITELPFLSVLKHFQAAGVGVPGLKHYNQARGLIYIEDLGDKLLRHAILESGPKARLLWLKKAVDELVLLQLGAGSIPDDKFIGYRARFSRKLLRWELEHFREWAIEKRPVAQLNQKEAQMLDRAFSQIEDEMFGAPCILSHRDYHIDNLMVVRGKIRVIDFQDAFLAAYPYDLACLLYDRDSSQILGEKLIAQTISYYFDRLAQKGYRPLDFKAYRRLFDLCVLHRAFKVVGRFYYLAVFKHKPEYLDFMPMEYEVLGKYLSRFKELVALKKVLQNHLPELK